MNPKTKQRKRKENPNKKWIDQYKPPKPQFRIHRTERSPKNGPQKHNDQQDGIRMTKKDQILPNQRKKRNIRKEPTTMYHTNIKINSINPWQKKKETKKKQRRKRHRPHPNKNENLWKKRKRWGNPHIKDTKKKPPKTHQRNIRQTALNQKHSTRKKTLIKNIKHIKKTRRTETMRKKYKPSTPSTKTSKGKNPR